MTADIHLSAPLDPASASALAARGLDLRLVRDDDPTACAGWVQAVARGFLDAERTPEQVDGGRARNAARRKIAVHDPSAPPPALPVGTFSSWIAPLTVPGGSIPSVAISTVTVAPTHRRRGIARAMMEGELRVAAGEGVPMAMLTVSESTIYGRYGFAPAASAATWRIETKRARWAGPSPDGRIDFISRERLHDLLPPLHERVRTRVPGEIALPAGHDGRISGVGAEAEKAGERRAIQYADAGGEVRGLAIYTVREDEDDFTKSVLTVGYLLAETDDAYSALWRFLLEHDLVAEVRASELGVDEPLLWMIADQRAARVTAQDHQYLRILDVPAALEARAYAAPGVLALEVDDPLGFAAGRRLLRVGADGRGTVSRWEGDAPADAVVVRLGAAELAAAYLGGVSLVTLARAGRVQTTDAVAAARVLSWPVAPRLSIWY